MPYDEIETRTIKENQALITPYAYCSWATAPEQFNIGINKAVLASFLESKGIPNPPSALPHEQGKISRMINDFGYPLLVKKTRSSAGRGIQKIFSASELSEFFNANDSDDYLIQPFLIDTDITCNIICSMGQIICHTLQESPVKTGEEYNANDTLTYHEDEEVLRIVGEMMKQLNWDAVACVDLRRDIKTGKPYILEINGRFWGSVLPSYIKAGVNFPPILAGLSLGITTDIPSPKPPRQYSLNAYFKRIMKGNWTSLHETKYMPYFQDSIARFKQVFIKS